MQRRFKQVFCAIKEHSAVSYAKIATVGGFCSMDLIIVKATAPDDLPLPEKYIRELLKIFSISPSSCHAFSLSFARHFSRTRCWRVALKCLLLLHRLLRSVPAESPFRAELLWARSSSLLSLYPCRFRDQSSSSPEDYTMFVRSYAHLVDEALNCLFLDCKESEERGREQELEEIESIQDKMKEVGRMLEILPQLQVLIDRVMECRPTGIAARSFIVQSAMKHIIRESFVCYTAFRKEIVLVLENLFQMPYRSCVSSFGIYKKASLQANQLCEFYDWCRAKGLCGAYEYPLIGRIPEIQIRALETFVSGMWQLRDQSSSSSTASPSSWMEFKSSSTEDDDKQVVVGREIVVSTEWEIFEEENDHMKKFEGNEEIAPLIQFEDDVSVDVGCDDDWEALLEASVNLSCIPRNNYLIGLGNGCGGYEVHGKGYKDGDHEKNQWQLQVYNPYASNPFCQPCHYMPTAPYPTEL